MNPTNSNTVSAYLRFGAEIWTRAFGITSSYGLRALNQVLANRGEWNEPKLTQAVVVELQNYCAEMALVMPIAIESFAAGELPDQEYRGATGPDSRPGKSCLIDGKPMMLPVRVGEASQGWALYFVPSDWAQSRLGEQVKKFIAIDTGTGRTPLIIYGIDHRESDLGSYLEIGVALLVRPRANQRELPGLLFLSLIVNGQFTIDASRTIWGFHKALASNMDVRYEDDFVKFSLHAHDPAAFSISFPRFGSGRSTRFPCYIYSVPEREDGVAHRTVLARSSAGEGIQIGGSVDLHLSRQPGCVCRQESRVDTMCVCSMLRDLRLPERPAANGWAESISGKFGPATPCT